MHSIAASNVGGELNIDASSVYCQCSRCFQNSSRGIKAKWSIKRIITRIKRETPKMTRLPFQTFLPLFVSFSKLAEFSNFSNSTKLPENPTEALLRFTWQRDDAIRDVIHDRRCASEGRGRNAVRKKINVGNVVKHIMLFIWFRWC